MKLLLILWLGLMGIHPMLSAAESGQSVVVIYNSNLPDSKSVAEHYAKRRQVPQSQILGLELPTTETMTRTEYRVDLQKPLWKWLDKQKLFTIRLSPMPETNGLPSGVFWTVKDTKVRYAVLCYGVPLRIVEDRDVREKTAESVLEPLRRNGAAVESELSLLPFDDLKLPLTGPIRNPFYGVTNTSDLTPINGLLMVARLDGPSAAIARGLVDKAIEAEATGLWGRAYFDARGLTNGPYLMGDEWFRKSTEMCRHYGFETVLNETPETFAAAFPMSRIALYGGWYEANVCGPFAQSQVEFAPGAFAYHLHSFSAPSIRTSTNFWVGPFLEKGVTITMGCVDEPFLALTPDIATFMARFIFGGFSFGEAAYASQAGLSWQTTVVGDPLYRPFAKKPPELHAALTAQNSQLIEWSHLGVVNLNIVQGYPIEEVITYLEENGKKSAVLMEKLGDVYEGQKKQWPAINAFAQALNLKPSLQQEIRLLLKLGNHLEEANRNQEALDMYKLLIKSSPNYPDLTFINKKIAALESKLGKASQ